MLRRTLATAAPIAAAALVVLAVVYAVAQQGYRNGADDPQHQLARDAAARLDRGEPPADVVAAETKGGTAVDLRRQTSPFVIVVDAARKTTATAGNATLDGDERVPPAGAIRKGNTFTWQPASGVREAVVVEATADGTRLVIAGRALRDVEHRIDDLTLEVALGMVAAVLVILATTAAAVRLAPRP